MKELKQLIRRLEEIAEANNDKFRYTINVVPNGNGLTFSFHADESSADEAAIVSGEGPTIKAAVAEAASRVDAALVEWCYADPARMGVRERRNADRIDGYDRDDLGPSPDF